MQLQVSESIDGFDEVEAKKYFVDESGPHEKLTSDTRLSFDERRIIDDLYSSFDPSTIGDDNDEDIVRLYDKFHEIFDIKNKFLTAYLKQSFGSFLFAFLENQRHQS